MSNIPWAVDDDGLGSVKINGDVLGTADNVLAVADYWHYQLDKGTLKGFSTGDLWGSGAAGIISNLIKPHSNISVRLLLRGSADMNLRLYVAPTVSGSGDAITPINFDQTVATGASGASFYSHADLSATGTLLYDQYIPSGLGKFGGGNAAAGADWSLAAGTNYNVVILGHAIGTFNLSGEYYTR